jgi:hypothetical protein
MPGSSAEPRLAHKPTPLTQLPTEDRQRIFAKYPDLKKLE